MIVLGIILAVIFIILLIPVGAYVSFWDGLLTVKLKLGPAKLQIVPGKVGKRSVQKKEKPVKAKPPTNREKKKPSFTKDDIVTIARIGLKALNRFRKSLCFEVLDLHICAGAPDPFDAVSLYGKINAAIGVLYPHLHRAVKIKKEDIAVSVDFERSNTLINARTTATLRIYEIFKILICAAYGFIVWYLRYKKRIKKLAISENSAEATADNGTAAENAAESHA